MASSACGAAAHGGRQFGATAYDVVPSPRTFLAPTPTIHFSPPQNSAILYPGMTTLPLSELLGATVYDPSGAATGHVREVTLAPQEDRDRIASFIVKTKSGNRVLPFSAVTTINADIHTSTSPADWPAANGAEGLFLLERDLLDQQVIDINGRKVVRVNDVDL